MENEELNTAPSARWTIGEPAVYPQISDLDALLNHIKATTPDQTLRILRMKRAIYAFPLPKEEKDIYSALLQFFAHCSKEKAGLFSGKAAKEDAKEHNALIPVWKDKCNSVILESALLYPDLEEMVNVLASYSEKLATLKD